MFGDNTVKSDAYRCTCFALVVLLLVQVAPLPAQQFNPRGGLLGKWFAQKQEVPNGQSAAATASTDSFSSRFVIGDLEMPTAPVDASYPAGRGSTPSAN